jgi:hypothetical protein
VTAAVPSLAAQRADSGGSPPPDGAGDDCPRDGAAEQRGMLTEPCRDVFKEPGRWIFL